jgi:hypothetical protein
MAARRRHLAQWPDAIDAAISSLDRVPAKVASAFLGSVRGLRSAIQPDDGDTGTGASAALDRLVDHLAHCAERPEADERLGAGRLVALPALTVHETFPGHANHALAMRQVTSPARRTLWSEPTYTRYGVGKFFFLDLREAAKRAWGPGFTLERFHTELLSLGSPPLAPVAEALGLGQRPTRWR